MTKLTEELYLKCLPSSRKIKPPSCNQFKLFKKSQNTKKSNLKKTPRKKNLKKKSLRKKDLKNKVNLSQFKNQQI